MIHSVTNLHGTNLTSCCWLCRWTVPWLSGAFYAVRETFLLVVRAPFRILHPCIRICLRCVQYVTVAATPCVDSCHYLGSSLTGFDYSYLLDSYWILPGGNGDQCTFLQSACLSVSAPLACKCIYMHCAPCHLRVAHARCRMVLGAPFFFFVVFAALGSSWRCLPRPGFARFGFQAGGVFAGVCRGFRPAPGRWGTKSCW